MSQKDEKARFDAAVQAEVGKIVAAQQAQFAQMMEQAMKASLGSMEEANAALSKEREVVMAELDAAREERAKAEREGDKMAQAYFEGRQKQFMEAAKTELLRDLARMHLEVGKPARDIALWLRVKLDFVERIREVMGRAAQYAPPKPKRLSLEGTPCLRFDDKGRGGTVSFDSVATTFDMWWEFAGGDALVIVGIPTVEAWERDTRLPLDKRDEVLQFIGEEMARKTYGGTFHIGESTLTIYPAEDR